MIKRIISCALVLLMLMTAACNNVPETTGTDSSSDPETTASPVTGTDTEPAAPGTETDGDDQTTEPVTDAETEGPIIDEEPVFYEKEVRQRVDVSTIDFSGTDWTDSINYANENANGVQGKFTDGARSAFTITNKQMSLTYHVLQNDAMLVNSITNSRGVPYFENSMDSYVRFDGGDTYLASLSLYSGRMNSQRLGCYYYDFRFRDQAFTSAEMKKPYAEGEPTVDILKDHGSEITGSGVKNLKYDGGILSFDVSSVADAHVRMYGLDISSEEYDAVQLTFKTDVSDIVGLFLCVDGEKMFSPNRQLVHRFNAGEESTVVIPGALMNDLHGKITGFKIYFGETVKGDRIEISEIRLIKRGGDLLPLLLEHSFHTYPDKLHEQLRLVATDSYTGGGYFGTTYVIPADTVRKMIIKNADGEVSEIPADFDFTTVEYVGFDVKGAGVFGIIMAKNKNGTINVELKDGNYVVTREITIGAKLARYGSTQFYHRIYTSDSHQFNDLRKQTYIERNPITDIQITYKDDGGQSNSYDQIRGCYKFSVSGAGFVDAYYQNPNRQPKIEIVFTCDGTVDRSIYLCVMTNSGALECSSALDQEMRFLPIPVQVSKNFGGEREESRYDPNDNSFCGEAYLPISLKAEDSKKITVVHLYQNWGNYPLKQLSSVSFIQPYYHLSIGVTETNCIAPYFVFSKDGWTLPDFRANSAPLWNSQPQHTSIGRLLIAQHQTDSKSPLYMSESQSADIASSGPLYADVTMDYLSDDGAFYTTYRHVELPQTDENRTYYEMHLKVLKDITIEDFKNNFSIYRFDSRYGNAMYAKISYVNENNEIVTEDVDMKRRRARIVQLGTESPYVAVYKPNYTVPGSENTGAVNFAYIIKSADITIGGEKYTKGVAFRESCYTSQTHLDLTLDLDTVTLKKGDSIDLVFILLPWGETKSADDGNVRNVRQDSCFSPYKITASTGTVIEDEFVPMIRADGGKAEFTFSGGANHGVVRVCGFESYVKPSIEMKLGDQWIPFSISGENGYDGYQAFYDKDGTYSFAFIVDMDAADSFEFRVTQ